MATKKGTKKTSNPANAANDVKNELRVRMYRVGFGDFFLITVPTPGGPKHILIDCGVHKGDIKTIDACIKDLIAVTQRKLALVIATHYHADHISGFGTNFDDFATFEVEAVWLPNRLDPELKDAVTFRAQIAAVANQLQLRLGAREDDAGRQALAMATNALGVGEGRNEKALRLLTEGFKSKPKPEYYQAGDEPQLPASLQGSITAELLGPAPLDTKGEFSTEENKSQQYLAAASERGLPPSTTLEPFEKPWPATSDDYSAGAFRGYRTPEQIAARRPGSPEALEKLLQDAQPDLLFAMAEAIDGTLNNQSLVVLFTCQGKKLLFVGDAQWGNWSYWLYGKKTIGENIPGITPKAKDILGSIDFYKVGHHGSTNANPIPAIAALNQECVSMCSTESADPDKKRPHGNILKKSEVPRILLMEEIEKRTTNKLVRSDWIEALTVHASPEAKGQLAQLPSNFETGPLYIDYVFPK
jgi:beta-lactamase superfamily II metal-dependent hydrolase